MRMLEIVRLGGGSDMVHDLISTSDISLQTVTAPGGAASAIQVAAHKKLTLVNLMLNGEVSILPFRYYGSIPIICLERCL